MQVLSSLSGIPFYAPSAAYAPTNGADVSSVASAYAESAASGKLDSSASSSFYPSDNPSGFISGVDLSNYATTAYVDSSVSSKLDATASSQFLTSVPSDYATTAYVDSSISGFAYESAVSGWTAKQDALTFGYDTSDKISSINGSSLAGEGGGGLVTSLQYYTSGSTSTGSGTAIGRANAGNSTGSINYYTLDFGEHDPSCITAVKYSQILITADKNSDFVTAWPLVSPDLSAFAIYKSVADTAAIGSVPASASSYVGRISTTTSDLGTAVRYNLTGYNFSSIKTGEENVLVLAYQYMPDNWGTLVVTGTTGSFVFNYENSEGYTAVSGINELGIYFDTSNCYPTSNPSGFISSVDLSNYATTAYVDSSVSSKLDATASSQFVTSTAGLATTADISGFAYESAVSGWTAKQDALTFGYDTANNISSIDGSAIGGQGGGGSIPIGTSGDYVTSVSSQMLMSVNSAIEPSSTYTEFSHDFAIFAPYNGATGVSSFSTGISLLEFIQIAGTILYSAVDTAGNTISEGELESGSSTLDVPDIKYFYYTGLSEDITYYFASAYKTITKPASIFEIAALSALSSKQDSLAFSYNPNSAITSINGSGIGADVSLPISGSSDNGTFYSADITVDNGFSVYQSSTYWQGKNTFGVSYIWMLETASGSGTSVIIDIPSVDLWNSAASSVSSKMDSSAVQSAYASASATQATAQGVLYILIPDGV